MSYFIRFEQIYSDENLIEILVSISIRGLSLSASCYTQIEKIFELSEKCEKYVSSFSPFEWFVGSDEYAYINMYIHKFDNLGHVRIDFDVFSDKMPTDFGRMKCSFSAKTELGQLDILGKRIKSLSEAAKPLEIIVIE